MRKHGRLRLRIAGSLQDGKSPAENPLGFGQVRQVFINPGSVEYRSGNAGGSHTTSIGETRLSGDCGKPYAGWENYGSRSIPRVTARLGGRVDEYGQFRCEMPKCYCHEGRGYFEPRSIPRSDCADDAPPPRTPANSASESRPVCTMTRRRPRASRVSRREGVHPSAAVGEQVFELSWREDWRSRIGQRSQVLVAADEEVGGRRACG